MLIPSIFAIPPEGRTSLVIRRKEAAARSRDGQPRFLCNRPDALLPANTASMCLPSPSPVGHWALVVAVAVFEYGLVLAASVARTR